MKEINLPLVSVVTPTYNGEEFIERFLNSVLKQTYKNIELILINDGSTDRTEEIVLSYSEKFKNKGITFKYIYQENKGISGALNNGFSFFKGKYLSWPDSDNILDRDNIQKEVDFLENNKNYDVVVCQSQLFDQNFRKGYILKRIPPEKDDNFFKDFIIEKNVVFGGGAFMIRSSAFDNVYPNRKIYDSRHGPNWQILLPILYNNNKCGYLDEVLYYVYERQGSVSRSAYTFEEKILKQNGYEDILLNTINSIVKMPENDKKYWKDIIRQKYDLRRLNIAAQTRDKNILESYYLDYKNKYPIGPNEKLIYKKGKSNFIYYFEKLIQIPRKIVRKIKRIFKKVEYFDFDSN